MMAYMMRCRAVGRIAYTTAYNIKRQMLTNAYQCASILFQYATAYISQTTHRLKIRDTIPRTATYRTWVSCKISINQRKWEIYMVPLTVLFRARTYFLKERDIRFPPRCKWDFDFSGKLRSVYYYLVTDVLWPIRCPEASINNHPSTLSNTAQ
jgi:hypothetical protein